MSDRKRASAILAAAALAALRDIAALADAREGMAAGAGLPQASIETGSETDWGWKGGEGREVRLSVALRGKAAGAEAMHALIETAEARIGALPDALPGWRIATLTLLRSRLVETQAGEWRGLIEWRARMYAD